MYPYIVCFCGRSLGDIYDLFKALRLEKYAQGYADAENGDIDPYMLAICESFDLGLSDIYEQLDVHLECCKTRLMTQTEFKDYY